MALRARLVAALVALSSLIPRPTLAQRSLDEGVATGLYFRSSAGPTLLAMLHREAALARLASVSDLDGDGDRDTLAAFALRDASGPPAWFALMRAASGYCSVAIAPHNECVRTCDISSWQCRESKVDVLRVAGRAVVAVQNPLDAYGPRTEYALFLLRECEPAVELWRATIDAADLRFVVTADRVALRSRRAAIRDLRFDRRRGRIRERSLSGR